jgi:hypothetical protein
MTGIRPKYELKITLDPPTAGKVDGAGSYIEGKRVKINVTTFSGWEFMEWIGDISDTNPNLEITVDKDITIIAKFKKNSKFSPVIISLSLASFLLLVINIAGIYKISEDKKTIDALNFKLLTIDKEKTNLNTKISKLETEKTNLNADINEFKTEKTNLNTKIKEFEKKVETLEKEKIDYTLYEGKLTSLTDEDTYPRYINAPKTVEAYLFDMTDDADLEILNEHKVSIASSKSGSGENKTVPDIINVRINSSGWYTFRVWRNPTKYKLKVYIRN